MALDSVSQLGKTLGTMKSEQEKTKQQISPDEVEAQEFITAPETITIGGYVQIAHLEIPSDNKFVLGHPVYSLADGTYQLGGDFVGSSAIIFTTQSVDEVTIQV